VLHVTRSSRLAFATALTLSTSLVFAVSDHQEEFTCGSLERHAQEAAAAAPFDPASAARIDHLAPDRTIDMEHIHITGRFPNLRDKWASFDTILIFSSMKEGVGVVDLDAVDFKEVHVERLSDKVFPALNEPLANPYLVPKIGPMKFYYTGTKLSIAFDPPLHAGERVAIRVSYNVEDTTDGLNWVVPPAGAADPRPEVWSQGQASDNRRWIPCVDYPNDMATSEELFTVAEPNVVIGNGDLVKMSENGDGTTTWHYRMGTPHVSYLISVIVGEFASTAEVIDNVRYEYFLPPDRRADLKNTYGKTPQMAKVLGDLFGTPYPYNRYAQTAVQDFTAGGMENITATTMNYRVMVDQNLIDNASMGCEGHEGLIAHEIGHQWFGDLVTCRNWTHLWLDEGWASYCELLWEESSCGRDEYDRSLWKSAANIADADAPDDLRPLVNVGTPSGDAMFGFKGGLVYDKGAYLLHMLRERLGSDRFFAGVKLYLERNRSMPVVTEDFRAAMEDVSDDDLEGWFRQWAYTPGTPRFDIGLDYDLETSAAIVSIKQTQKADLVTPAFFADFDLFFVLPDGTTITRTVKVTSREHSFRVPMAEAPTVFCPDPRGAVLKGLTLSLPLEMLIANANSAPTTFAKLDAIRQIAASNKRDAIDALKKIALDESRSWGEREQAILPFRGKQTEYAAAALAEIAAAKMPDYRLRRCVAEALGGHASEIAVKPLIALCADNSDVVAREALEEVGRMTGDGIYDALVAGFNRGGNLDRVRHSAITGMERLKDPRAAELLFTVTGVNTQRDTRTRAIRAMVALAEDDADRERYAKALLAALRIEDGNAQSTIAGALGNLRYAPAREQLEQLSFSSTNAGLAASARDAVAKIDAEEPAPAKPSGELFDRLVDLEKENAELRERMDELDQRATEAFIGAQLETRTEPEKKTDSKSKSKSKK
jgi:aminopeptidase N